MAGVGGLVEAREVAFTTGHDDGGVLVEGLNTSEIEFLGVGWRSTMLPGFAIIGCAQNGALSTAGPGDTAADVIDATKVGGGIGLLDHPLSSCRMVEQSQDD
jgi:hypothetical protein